MDRPTTNAEASFGLVLALYLGCAAAPVSGQTVRGLVLDAATDRPVALATVSLMSTSGDRVSSMLTNEDGFFTLDADDDGRFILRAVALGYRLRRVGPFDLETDGVSVLELRLEPAPVGLEGFVVEGAGPAPIGNNLTRNGFWERLEEGRGQFLTPGDVARSDALFTPHLLRGLDHVIPQYGDQPWMTWVNLRRATGDESGPCEPKVFVDGMWMNRPGFGIRESAGLDEVIPLELVYAVEVYWGPFQAPLRYQGPLHDNDCGVILFWTNSR